MHRALNLFQHVILHATFILPNLKRFELVGVGAPPSSLVQGPFTVGHHILLVENAVDCHIKSFWGTNGGQLEVLGEGFYLKVSNS